MLSAIATILIANQHSRFELVAPFPSIRWAKIQTEMANVGIAQRLAHEQSLQGRVMWIDGTANLDACNSKEKIAALMAKLKSIGFNTVVYDVKPIVGYTIYPSKLTEQLTSWKGQSIPAGFDPLAAMIDSARANGLKLFVAMNAFSEGHSYSKRDEKLPDTQFGKPGWGYEHPELQTTQYIALPTLTPAFPDAPTWDVHPKKGEAGAAMVSVWGSRPPKTAGSIFATVGMDGSIASVSEEPMAPGTGQVVAAFKDSAGEYMSSWASVGRRLWFKSKPQFSKISENQTQIPLMMNPHDVRNVERAGEFVREVATNYDIDGILYDDRLRFGGMNTDFSESTREEFEKKIGANLNWPSDVFEFTVRPDLVQGIRPGPYFDAWLAFRAKAMTDAVGFLRGEMREIRPQAQFGVYAGSWYGDYVKYGANYASREISAGFPFLTEAYRSTGFAPGLDVVIAGCYYPIGTVYEAMAREAPVGRTVEAAGILTNRVIRDQCWTYAGLMLADYWGDPTGLETALQAAAATTQGVMIFDLSHQFEKFEPILRRAFKKKVKAPHQVNGLLDILRQKRRELDAKGIPDPPFPLFEGAPGAGF